MSPFFFAWRSLTRQPARALLGIVGVAIVGALLLDMLMLSRGLAVSFRDLLEEAGFDVRVTAGQFVPSRGPMIRDGKRALATLRQLPEVDDALLLRFGRAQVATVGREEFSTDFMGVEGPARGTWTVVEGEGLPQDPTANAILVNRALAERAGVEPGDVLSLRGACDRRASALPPVDFRVAGIVVFRFDIVDHPGSVTSLEQLLRACDARDPEAVTLLMVASDPLSGAEEAVRAIRRELPDLHAFTNQEFVDNLQGSDFSYFRQIAFALSTITLFFAFLLIATLLTVSVNQRLAEVATLRALGFRRGRIVADLIWESCLLVGSGGLLALPLGGVIALWLDAILREMPGIPMHLHFFVFQVRAAATYAGLLAATGALAAAYPVYLAARLPITATLRREVVS